MASQNSSPPPPSFLSQPSQQPPLHHLQQPPHTILMGPSQNSSPPPSFLSQPSQQPPLHHLQQPPHSFISHQQHNQQPQIQTQPQPLFPINSVITDGGGGGENSSFSPADGPAGFSMETSKKKRGRPRKNPLNVEGGSRIALGLSPTPVTPSSAAATVTDSIDGAKVGTHASERRRGRPPGSVKKQIDALGASGTKLTPHVIMVNAGEDIASKIMEFTQLGPHTVCIMCANGPMCNVTLRQPASSTGIVTYEGRFEIISLTGSFVFSEINGGRRRVGGLSLSMSSPDGRVLGGGVAGKLIAAAPVQVIVGSFLTENVKKQKFTPPLASPGSPAMAAAQNTLSVRAQVPTEDSPPSPGGGATSNSSGEDNGGETNDGRESYDNNSGQPMQNIPMYTTNTGSLYF